MSDATFVNTPSTYGGVAKSLHWATALLILTAFPVGVIAHELPYDTSAQLATKAMLFSVHKTLGVSAFFVALARILWALSQPKPGLLHPDRKLESFAAEAVHWMLYISLVIVPLSGWLHHAASEGFAPIWWPFGQSLPFVPKSAAVSEFFGAWHWLFTKLLAASLFLHIAGALKHHVIDRDSTLRRMLPGAVSVEVPAHEDGRAPLLAAVGLWALAIALGSALGLSRHEGAAPVAQLEAASSGWSVTEGALGLEVIQFGAPVKGEFAEWTAAIDFDPEATGEVMGHVTTQIAIGSLTLGTVSGQAMGADYFDAATFPTAVFDADIIRAADGYVASGTLTLKGVDMPLDLPFTLQIDGDVATASGQTRIDRRSHGIGPSGAGDEANLGFMVDVTMALTATREE